MQRRRATLPMPDTDLEVIPPVIFAAIQVEEIRARAHPLLTECSVTFDSSEAGASKAAGRPGDANLEFIRAMRRCVQPASACCSAAPPERRLPVHLA